MDSEGAMTKQTMWISLEKKGSQGEMWRVELLGELP